MEMDRGRADPQRLGELAQAEPVRADALDQLGGGDDDRRFAQAGAGSGLPIRTRGLLFWYFDDGHNDASRISRLARDINSSMTYSIKPAQRDNPAEFSLGRDRAPQPNK